MPYYSFDLVIGGDINGDDIYGDGVNVAARLEGPAVSFVELRLLGIKVNAAAMTRAMQLVQEGFVKITEYQHSDLVT